MSLNILIVDDDVCCRMVNGMACKQAFQDPEIRYAFDGLNALDELTRFTPDLIITDFSMGKMNGETFTLNVRELFPNLRLCPILLVTGSVYQGVKAEVFSRITPKGNFEELVKDITEVMEGIA